MIIRFAISSLITSFFLASTVHAGIILSYKEKQSIGDVVNDMTLSLEGHKLRIDGFEPGPKGLFLIFDGDTKTLTVVNPQDKSYSEMSEGDFLNMQQERRKQIEDVVAKMSPEERKRAEETMKKMAPPPSVAQKRPEAPKFEPLGALRTYHDFSCEPYRVIRDEKPSEEVCLIPWKQTEFSQKDFEVLEKYKSFLDMNEGNRNDHSFFTEPSQYPGIPAYSTTLTPNGSHQMEMELTSLKKQKILDSKFVVPTGFSKKAFE